MKYIILALCIATVTPLTSHAQNMLETQDEANARRQAEYYTIQSQNNSPLYTPNQNLGGEWVDNRGNRVQLNQPQYGNSLYGGGYSSQGHVFGN